MSTTTTHDDQPMRRTYGAVAVCGLGLAALSGMWMGAAWSVSVAAGASVAVGNLWALSRAVRNLLASEGTGTVPWSLVAVLKFFALLALTYLLVQSPQIQALGLALGFGALPLGIVFGSLLQAPSASERRLNEETDHA
jgi:hypothetical protein